MIKPRDDVIRSFDCVIQLRDDVITSDARLIVRPEVTGPAQLVLVGTATLIAAISSDGLCLGGLYPTACGLIPP